MTDNASPLNFETLRDWVLKGLFVHKLNGRDGEPADSAKRALESLGVGFAVAAAIQFLVVFMFQKDLKVENLLGISLFAVPLALSLVSFFICLLTSLWLLRVRLSTNATFSLTSYVFSGAIPLLVLFSYEQLSEAIRLFLVRRDPSLPHLGSAVVKLLFDEQASTFRTALAWILFALEIVALFWYFLWNLPRVLTESSNDLVRDFA